MQHAGYKFDLTQDTLIKNESWIDIGVWETFCVCRRCHRATIFVLEQKNKDHGELKRVGLKDLQGVVNDNAVIRSHINITNIKTRPSPEHLPDSIAAAFQEGSKCLAISCFNAAAAMFRLSLDLAIKGLFPGEAVKDSTLGLRLKRLFDNKMLPEALQSHQPSSVTRLRSPRPRKYTHPAVQEIRGGTHSGPHVDRSTLSAA